VKSSGTFALACCVWLATALAIAAVAAVTALAARGSAQRSLLLTFPERSRLADVFVVVLHNGALTGAMLLAARRPSRTSDLAFGAAWLVNAGFAGLALGGYGYRLIAHAGIYAAIELAACSVPIAVYLRARARLAGPTLPDVAATAVLVALAASFETVLPVRL
jgi:hypothetical protein